MGSWLVVKPQSSQRSQHSPRRPFDDATRGARALSLFVSVGVGGLFLLWPIVIRTLHVVAKHTMYHSSVVFALTFWSLITYAVFGVRFSGIETKYPFTTLKDAAEKLRGVAFLTHGQEASSDHVKCYYDTQALKENAVHFSSASPEHLHPFYRIQVPTGILQESHELFLRMDSNCEMPEVSLHVALQWQPKYGSSEIKY